VKRVLISIAATAAVALPAALANASGVRAELELRRTAVGTILVNARGFTVYAFSRDSRNKDACKAIRLCLSVWPPVTTSGEPLAGAGVSSDLIGTITLRTGVKQVTYGGRPLYTYIADRRPGQTTYVNLLQFGGRWPAVNAAGREVK
jgi:predicted lipoprotein with Yx(FWY)xxD motif